MSSTTTSAIVTYDDSNEDYHSNHESQNTVILDSLPYIDNLHPDYEAYALTLIEEEMQNMANNDNIPSDEIRLRHLPNPLGSNGNADTTPAFKSSKFNNESLNQNEYDSLVARGGQPRVDIIDYKDAMRSTKPSDTNNTDEWKEAIIKAKTELEHERLRMVKLELQSEYESSLWKYHTQKLETISNNVKSALSQQQMKVDKINARRQNMQIEKAAPKLHILNQKWDEGLNKVKVLANGVRMLSKEVEELRKITGVSFDKKETTQESDDEDL